MQPPKAAEAAIAARRRSGVMPEACYSHDARQIGDLRRRLRGTE